MEEVFDRYQVPAFGNWNYYDHEFPITQCFESLVQAGTIGGHAFGDDGGLFRVAIPATYNHHQRKIKKGQREGRGGEKPQQQHGKQQQRKQGRVVEAGNNRRAPRRQRSPKAVDEDLYKIPSELIFQKTKRERSPRGMWLGCLGLNCIAA